MTERSCPCRRPPFHFADYDTVLLGEDDRGAEVARSTCRRCGALWLEYRIEEPHYSRSGRWWRVGVPPESEGEVTAATARAFIERQPEGFVGGSYFDSRGRAVTAPILVA